MNAQVLPNGEELSRFIATWRSRSHVNFQLDRSRGLCPGPCLPPSSGQGGPAPVGPRSSSSPQRRRPSRLSSFAASRPRRLFPASCSPLHPLTPPHLTPSGKTNAAPALASRSTVTRKVNVRNSFSEVIFKSRMEIAIDARHVLRGEKGFLRLQVDQRILAPRLHPSRPRRRHCRCSEREWSAWRVRQGAAPPAATSAGGGHGLLNSQPSGLCQQRNFLLSTNNGKASPNCHTNRGDSRFIAFSSFRRIYAYP